MEERASPEDRPARIATIASRVSDTRFDCINKEIRQGALVVRHRFRQFAGGRQEPSSVTRLPLPTTPTRPVTAAGPEEDDQRARRRPYYAYPGSPEVARHNRGRASLNLADPCSSFMLSHGSSGWIG